MTDTAVGLHRIRSLAEKLKDALNETGEAPNLDEFTPNERAQIRKTFPLYDTDEKLGAAVYFIAIASDTKGRRALEWMLTCFMAVITVWDGLMVVVKVIRWLRSSIGQILLAGGVIAAFTLDKEEVMAWLSRLLN